MSLFSSLCLFYPGKPPKFTVGDLRLFSSKLRQEFAFGRFIQSVELKYGKSIDRDLKTTNLMEQVGTFMWQTVSYPWDYEKREGEWNDLWPEPSHDSKVLYRANISFGSLPSGVSDELTAMSPIDNRSYIAPDCLSLHIDPFSPGTLAGEDLSCFGMISLNLAGNGFFTWQPLPEYWQRVRNAPSLTILRRLCRESFPAPAFSLEQFRRDLGPLFMNYEDYKSGDWIVTVSETG